MRKQDLKDLNTELVELLAAMRDQIDEKLDEVAAVSEDEDEGDDEDIADEDDAADDETDED